MELGQWIVIALSVVMGIWFGVGSIYNRRRGVDVYKWLYSGLKSLGKVSEAKWIGSSGSGARLVIGKANAPFQRIEVIFLLESREILPLWLFNRLRNKQDEMIMKAGLRRIPSEEVEVARSGDQDFRALLVEADRFPFKLLPSEGGFEMAHRGRGDSSDTGSLKSFLGRYGAAVQRISIQRKTPHLMVRAYLPPLRKDQAEDFFQAIGQLVSGY